MSTRLSVASATDPSQLTPELRDYYNGNKEEIMMNMFASEKYEGRFRVIEDVKGRMPLFNMDIDVEATPQVDYTNFAPQNDVFKIENRYLQTEESKVDLIIYPQQMARSYFGKKYKPGSNLDDMAFEDMFFSKLGDALKEKIFLKAAYRGVYNAAGGNGTFDIFDGVNKVIADELALATPQLVATATGPITATNVVDKLEIIADKVTSNAKWGEEEKVMPVNNEIFTWYWKKRRADFGDIVKSLGGDFRHVNELPFEGYNIKLVREHGLGTSQRVTATPVANKCIGFDLASDVNNIVLQPFNRGIKVMIDFKAGFNFAYMYDGSIVTNDQV